MSNLRIQKLAFFFSILLSACGSPVEKPEPNAGPPESIPTKTESSVSITSGSAKKLSNWQLNNEDLLLLPEKFKSDPSQSGLAFELKLPEAYRTASSKNYYSENFFFFNRMQKDAKRPALMLSILKDQNLKQDPLKDCLQNAISASKKAKAKEWSQSEIESGEINGIPFLRQYWTAFDPEERCRVFGFVYAARYQKRTMLFLSTQSKNDSLVLNEKIVRSMLAVQSPDSNSIN